MDAISPSVEKKPTMPPTPTIHDGMIDAKAKDTEGQEQVQVLPSASADSAPAISSARRNAAIAIVCIAQFLDIFVASSTIVSIPTIAVALGMKESETTWTISAYTLTFASFQLIGGRLSDIFHPKPVFIAGCFIVGIMSILCAVSVDPIMLLVFRAVQGIGASMSVPSAVAFIVQIVPNPRAQSRALAWFGASGAVGNASGFVIGGIITSQASWVWVFYLVAILILPLCIPAYLIIPDFNMDHRGRKLDLPGVGALTCGLILFVYALSDASNSGWGTPQIIVTLIFSVIFVAFFLYIETKVADPVVPPRAWSTKNIIPLFLYSLSIYWWLYVSELQLVDVFQDLFGWSALKASIHCLPIGFMGFLSAYFSGKYGPRIPRRILLPAGQVLMGVGALLFALSDSPSKYWSHIFVGMLIGMVGVSIGYVGVMVGVMVDARKGEEGVVGALMNTAFQLGATIGLAISSSVVVGVNNKLPSDVPVMDQFKGYQDGFWALLALHGLMTITSVILVR